MTAPRGRQVARSALGLAVAMGLAGCASTSPKPALDEVSRTIEQRSGHAVKWDVGGDDDKAANDAVDRLLRDDLTAESAVQVALLASPALRAKLEELSIAQADLVQAGLLKNPAFTFGRTAWESEHITPNLFGNVEMDFLDVVMLPLRKRVAAAELEAVKLEVADEVLEVAANVRAAFYGAQSAEQTLLMRRLVEQAAQASAELAERQSEAGNMNELALGNELSLAAQTTIDRRRAEGDAAVAREALNRAMGAWGHRTGYRLGPKLPELPAAEPPLERLEAVAIERRLDVGAARRTVQSLEYALSLAKTTRWTGTVNVAVEAGRLRHNRRISFGPSVTLEIPLFDQRRAQVAKLEAHVRKGRAELHALAIDVRADVRAARARLVTARGLVEDYGKKVVPLRERVVRASQEQYDAMLLGVYQLILAKQNEYEAYREYIEALRDYWIARSDLERAVGARLEGASASAAASAPGTASVAPAPSDGEPGGRAPRPAAPSASPERSQHTHEHP